MIALRGPALAERAGATGASASHHELRGNLGQAAHANSARLRHLDGPAVAHLRLYAATEGTSEGLESTLQSRLCSDASRERSRANPEKAIAICATTALTRSANVARVLGLVAKQLLATNLAARDHQGSHLLWLRNTWLQRVHKLSRAKTNDQARAGRQFPRPLNAISVVNPSLALEAKPCQGGRLRQHQLRRPTISGRRSPMRKR